MIAVGGLAVGGAGKTPVTAWIAEALATEGRSVAVVVRGYGEKIRRPTRLTRTSALEGGDEGAMLRGVLPDGIAVWAGGDLAAAAEAASAEADVVVVDDGWLARSMPRDLEIVVIDAAAPRRLWPAGPLRIPLSEAATADLIWLNNVQAPGAAPLDGAHVESVIAVDHVVDPQGRRWGPARLAGESISAWCAIGRPDSFYDTLRGAGARLIWAAEGRDHVTPPLAIRRQARAAASICVITAKDAARDPEAAAGCWVLHTRLEIVAGGEALAARLAALGASR